MKSTPSRAVRLTFSLVTWFAALPMGTTLAQSAAPDFSVQSNSSSATAAANVRYPETARVEHFDDYHGTRIADPYRWLEDANSPQTQAWVEEENKVTFAYLRAIPSRERIRQRLTEVWDYERYGVPFKEGGHYFFSRNTGLQNQNVIFTAPSVEEAAAGRAQLLLDPNKLSEGGTVALSSYSITDDGRLMAYGVQTSGSDWIEWRVREVATGHDLPDVIKWSKFSGASWLKDGSGFFYSAYDPGDEKTKLQSTNYFQKLYFHKIGTPQSDDLLIYQRQDQKEWGFAGEVTEDGKYLVITVSQGTDPKNRVFYKSLKDGPAGAPVIELLDQWDARYNFVANRGSTFYFLTNKDAPRARLVSIDVARYDEEAASWQQAHAGAHGGTARTDAPPSLNEIIPQSAETLQGVDLVGGRFIANYLQDAHSVVKIFAPEGGRPLAEVPFPGLGTAAGFGGKADDPETFFSFASYTAPTRVYRYDARSNPKGLLQDLKKLLQLSHIG